MDKPGGLYMEGCGVPVSRSVTDAVVKWCDRSGKEVQKMLEAFREEISVECCFERKDFAIVFTSGASEANSLIITSAVRSYGRKTGRLPHLVAGSTEHGSVLECCRALEAEGACQLTVLAVNPPSPGAAFGAVSAGTLKAALRPNTCLISITAANGDTGILSDLGELSGVARAARVAFHTDASLLFGRAAFRPTACGVDAFSASFRKFGGPPGAGALVVRRLLVDGYGLGPLVHGGAEQNEGLRGGALNVPGLAGAFTAFRLSMKGHAQKSTELARARDRVWAALAAAVPCFYAEEHPADRPPSIDGFTPPAERPYAGTEAACRALAEAKKGRTAVVFRVAPRAPGLVLPGCLLLAVRRRGFDAGAARAALEKRGVLAGVPDEGLGARLGLPAAMHGALLRVGLCDGADAHAADALARHLLAVVTAHA